METPLVEEVLMKGNYCLIFKLITNKLFNKEVLKQTMRRVWRSVKVVHFRDLGSKLLLVAFEDKKDKERVIKGLWTFDRQLVLV